MEKDGDYNSDLDLQFFKPTPQESTLCIDGNTFFVFFPEDAHRPKINLRQSGLIKNKLLKTI